MKIIFAQGNPGAQYTHTRHNMGFLMLDEFAATHSAIFNPKPKFHAEIAEITLQGEKVLLVKPTTFYNDTGIAARALIDFYKLNPAVDFLVVHDELALPFGVIKVRINGSDAGNNGIKSLNSHIGEEYYRLRIGIYNSLRDQVNDAQFVLAVFSQEEKEQIPVIYTHFVSFGEKFISSQLSSTKIMAFNLSR